MALSLGILTFFSAADGPDILHGIGRVNAKLGSRDQISGQSQIDQKLGDRRHERGDAGVRAGRCVGRTVSVDEDVGVRSHPDFVTCLPAMRQHTNNVLCSEKIDFYNQ